LSGRARVVCMAGEIDVVGVTGVNCGAVLGNGGAGFFIAEVECFFFFLLE
jgi:hypothetical protein